MSSPERDGAVRGTHDEDAVATLRDGRSVRIRPTRASDETEFVAAFERMDAQARYMRFMRAVPRPNLARLHAVLATLGERVLGVVATVPAADGFDIVGSAIVVRGTDPSTGEFAVSTVSGWGGSGLGRALMDAVLDAARRAGLREVVGFVLAENRPMLRLARRLGFTIAADPEGPSVRVCTKVLDRPPR